MLNIGSPGVGKTAGIIALQDLACKWKKPNSVLTAAFTHAASNNVRGITIHSAFNLPVFDHKLEKKHLSPGHRNILLNVRLIIIDEVGQAKQDLIGILSRRMKGLLDGHRYFGGVDTVLVLDWLQVCKPCGLTTIDVSNKIKSANEC
jgi:hypothetical protein